MGERLRHDSFLSSVHREDHVKPRRRHLKKPRRKRDQVEPWRFLKSMVSMVLQTLLRLLTSLQKFLKFFSGKFPNLMAQQEVQCQGTPDRVVDSSSNNNLLVQPTVIISLHKSTNHLLFTLVIKIKPFQVSFPFSCLQVEIHFTSSSSLLTPLINIYSLFN